MLKLSLGCFRSEEKPLAHEGAALPLPLLVTAAQVHLPFIIPLPLLGYDFTLLILSWAGFLPAGSLVSILQKPLGSFQAGVWEEICSFHTVLTKNAEYASLATAIFHSCNHVCARFPVGASECGSSGSTSGVQTGVIRWSGSHFEALCPSTWHLNLK